MGTLTPYDTGAVLQPRTWVTATAGLTSSNEDDFGRVDFDNDEGSTVLAGLRAMPSTTADGYAATVVEFSTTEGLVIVRCLDAGTRIRVEVGDTAARPLDADEIVSGFEDFRDELDSEGDAAALADDSRGIAQLVARWISERGLTVVAPEVLS
jgi:hypothetical protein